MKIVNPLWLAVEPREEEKKQAKIQEVDPELKRIFAYSDPLHYAQDTLRQYIEKYKELGLNIIPAKKGSKEPAVPWKEYQERQSTNEEIEKWFFHPMETWPDNWQITAFLIHWIHETYLIPKIREIHAQHDNPDQAKKLAFKFEEPWCYWRWPTHLNEKVPSTRLQLDGQLDNILTFLKEHIEKDYMWGLPILRKKGVKFFSDLIKEPHEERLAFVEYMFTELQATWLAHYPWTLLTKIYNNVTLGALAYNLLKDKISKPNLPDIAEALGIHANTAHRKVMPKIRKHRETLKQLGIEVHSRK